MSKKIAETIAKQIVDRSVNTTTITSGLASIKGKEKRILRMRKLIMPLLLLVLL